MSQRARRYKFVCRWIQSRSAMQVFRTSKILILRNISIKVLARFRSWQDGGRGKTEKPARSFSTCLCRHGGSIYPLFLFCMYSEFKVNSTLTSHNILVFYQIQQILCHHQYYKISYLGVSAEHFRILY